MCDQAKVITTDWMGFETGDAYAAGTNHPLPRRNAQLRWIGIQVLQAAMAGVITVQHGGTTRLRLDNSGTHFEEVFIPVTDAGEGWTIASSVGGGVLVTYYRDTPR